mgnify:CR=1 FL=1|tara:strand:+ start:3815 stop:4159 length:345 start_codon:yes stop_codon:yes gene_type:complete
MANNKNSVAICDTCGFRYPHRVMRMNSYGMLVCPTDWDGAFNLVNSPQNKSPDVRDDENIRNPRPDVNIISKTYWDIFQIPTDPDGPYGDMPPVQAQYPDTNQWEAEDRYWNMV